MGTKPPPSPTQIGALTKESEADRSTTHKCASCIQATTTPLTPDHDRSPRPRSGVSNQDSNSSLITSAAALPLMTAPSTPLPKQKSPQAASLAPSALKQVLPIGLPGKALPHLRARRREEPHRLKCDDNRACWDMFKDMLHAGPCACLQGFVGLSFEGVPLEVGVFEKASHCSPSPSGLGSPDASTAGRVIH